MQTPMSLQKWAKSWKTNQCASHANRGGYRKVAGGSCDSNQQKVRAERHQEWLQVRDGTSIQMDVKNTLPKSMEFVMNANKG
jgi:hypothetical protein